MGEASMNPRYFEFCNPGKILVGEQALNQLSFELDRLKVKKPLLLISKSAKKSGYYRELMMDLEESGHTPGCIYSEVPQDSSLDVVNRIAKQYWKTHCDGIVAIGGGSVLDTAKGVKIVVSQEGEDIRHFCGVDCLIPRRSVALIAIPTTVGTGSEVSNVTVLCDTQRNQKLEFVSNTLIPDTAILDPRTTRSLPPRLIASTGMDAMVHAIEAYTCLQKNPISDALAHSAIQMISQNIRKAVSKNRSGQSTAALSCAALMAGAAFSNSMVGLVHAVGHGCGGISHVPHGEVMAVLLPYVMRFNRDVCDDLYGELLLPLSGAEVFAATQRRKRGDKAIEVLREILLFLHEKCNLPRSLRELGIRPSDFEEITQAALSDGALLYNPKQVTRRDVLTILEEAYEAKND